MKNITLGQYIPLDSFFHKLDPRSKICAMMAILIAIFIPAGFIGYAILGVVLIACILLAKLQISFVIKAMKPMVMMMFFLTIINVFVIRTGNVLWTLGPITIYDDALKQTGYIVVRLAFINSHDQADGHDSGH